MYLKHKQECTITRLPKEEQLVVMPFVMQTICMAGLWECAFGPWYPDDDEVTEVRLRYAGFREGSLLELCWTYITRYFSLYEHPAS